MKEKGRRKQSNRTEFYRRQNQWRGVWLKQWLKFIQPVPHASFANTENKKSALKFVLDMYKRNSNGLYSDNIQSHAIHEIAK